MLETDLDRGAGIGAGAGGSCVQGPGWTMPIHGWLVFTLGLPLVGLVLRRETRGGLEATPQGRKDLFLKHLP